MVSDRLHVIRVIFEIFLRDVKTAVCHYACCSAGCFGSQVGELEITCFILLDFMSFPECFLTSFRAEQ